MSQPLPPAAVSRVRPRWVGVWAWPVALGLLTASGLVGALISDSAGQPWSWLALGLPTVTMTWFACFGSRRYSS